MAPEQHEPRNTIDELAGGFAYALLIAGTILALHLERALPF